MKSWKLVCSLVGVSALLTVTSYAANQPCQAGCGLQNKACIQTARTTKLSCKMDCRTNSSPGDLGTCMRGCTSTFRTAIASCRAGLQTCISGCQGGSADGAFTGSPTGGTACAGNCGEGLGTCAQGVVTTAKACVQGCRGTSDPLSCLQGCASAAQSGGQACAASFQACITACSPTS